MMNLKTEFQQAKEERENAIYEDYTTLTADPANAKTKVNEHLMHKYGIHSMGTIYDIVRRVKARRDEQN